VLLTKVRDHRPVADPWDPKDDLDEVEAYYQFVFRSYLTSVDSFANSADKTVTRAHLFSLPVKYRGEVVHVEGQLKQLRRFDAPAALALKGISAIYEGWIFDAKRYGANPTCVLFTELPERLAPSDDVNQEVAFDGYFFKLYRYESRDAGKLREAPLLIGRMPIVQRAAERPAASSSGSGWGSSLLMGFVGLLMGTVALAAGLTWWFHRGDRRVRARLAGAYRVEFHEPAGPESTPMAGPVASADPDGPSKPGPPPWAPSRWGHDGGAGQQN
jgi:hypothetical protein